jgi:hypothetical protein
MTIALIDDQLLGAVLRGQTPAFLAGKELYTTGYWYVRLCQAVAHASERTGKLSGPFADLPPDLREHAIQAVLELPTDVGLLSLRELGPVIGQLHLRHQLNTLAMDALAAAKHLGAEVHLSAHSPLLEAALAAERISVHIQ